MNYSLEDKRGSPSGTPVKRFANSNSPLRNSPRRASSNSPPRTLPSSPPRTLAQPRTLPNSPPRVPAPESPEKIVTPAPRAAKKDYAKANGKKTKEYTNKEIHELITDGYLLVPPLLWDRVPKGSHIRYLKKDRGDGISRGARFKPGGFVRNHFTNKDKKKMIMVENILGGKTGTRGYFSFPVTYEDVEHIWKKYDYHSFVEIHLINNSLAQKKRQNEEMTRANAEQLEVNKELARRIDRLETILKNAIK